ncbi:hypothetical protein AciM339_0336 [Aciduliprofundum sp. MAR08-339]|uniref:hypothetical protein n=1 Tax=Aciduliprofundum sp. (strain MAR08-339) TaxID=673860 RepID=UPI0002A49CCF|nr:hypothetical protein AciM339_0336 [Aciduliprofundum sp. MAR08-339]
MVRWLWILSWMLLTIGVVFYFSWSFLYDAWTDLGVYSLSVSLIVFGILGTLLAKVENQ